MNYVKTKKKKKERSENTWELISGSFIGPQFTNANMGTHSDRACLFAMWVQVRKPQLGVSSKNKAYFRLLWKMAHHYLN